jgi:hypothetical protein
MLRLDTMGLVNLYPQISVPKPPHSMRGFMTAFGPLILACPVYSQILTELAERDEDLALPTNLHQDRH